MILQQKKHCFSFYVCFIFNIFLKKSWEKNCIIEQNIFLKPVSKSCPKSAKISLYQLSSNQCNASPSFSAWEGGIELPTKFLKKGWGGGGGLERTLIFRGSLWKREGVTFSGWACNFYMKDKLKSEIFNDKKVYEKTNIEEGIT